MTDYLIRTADRPACYLAYLAGGCYGWTSRRKEAARYAGRGAVLEALAVLETAIAGAGYALPRLSAVPATGGTAVVR